MNGKPAIYKLPLRPVITTLEGIRKRGSELKREIEDDMPDNRYKSEKIEHWNKLNIAFNRNSQKLLDEIYRTTRQSDEFGDSFKAYSRVIDLGNTNSFIKILSKLTGRLKYIDGLLEEAYKYEEESNNYHNNFNKNIEKFVYPKMEKMVAPQYIPTPKKKIKKMPEWLNYIVGILILGIVAFAVKWFWGVDIREWIAGF